MDDSVKQNVELEPVQSGENDTKKENSQNIAASLASRLQSSQTQAPKRRLPVADLADDGSGMHLQDVEFVCSKKARQKRRAWVDEKTGAGALPKKRSQVPPFVRVIVVLCATLGMCLFGYRMYKEHWEPQRHVQYVYTASQLAKHNSNHNKPWVAVLGEIYDVSKAKKFYGKKGGYSFFTGRDASRAYITGKFEDDLNDHVTDFTPEQMHGLKHWRDFYLKEYIYIGRVQGSFYDSDGVPTEQVRKVWEGSATHEAAELQRKNKRLAYPNCNSRWSSKMGSEVWCDDGLFPRLLTEEVAGNTEQRCACFRQRGWSQLRKVYDGCSPDAHRCSVETMASIKDVITSEGKATSEEASCPSDECEAESGSGTSVESGIKPSLHGNEL